MVRVMILGPYSGSTLEVARNIRRGMDLAGEVALAGFALLPCWWDWSIATRVDLSMEWFKSNTQAWIPCADAIILTEGWEKSGGVADDLRVASKHGVPTFSDIDELIRWRDASEPLPTNAFDIALQLMEGRRP